MTEWFQSTWMGEGFGWFLATLILILMIALPLMLAVAMIIYADRKIWRRWRFVAVRTWSGRSVFCKALPMV